MRTRSFVFIAVGLMLLPGTMAEAQETKVQQQLVRNMVRLEAGYALTGLKKENFSPWGKDHYRQLKGGPAVTAGYSRLLRQGRKDDFLYLGVEYRHLDLSSGEYAVKETGSPVEDHVRLHYVAPQAMWIWQFSDEWRTHIGAGLGYALYNNNGKKDGAACVTNAHGLGLNIDVRLEWMAGERFSITAGLEAMTGWYWNLRRKQGGAMEKLRLNDDYGFSPTYGGFMAGFRYYW